MKKKIKVVAVSDQHGFLPVIPPCDLFLICGDLCPATNHQEWFQENWLETNFKYWLRDVDAKKKVFIFGNHDLIGESSPEKVKKIFSNYPGIYLEDSGVEFEGYKIWGTPHQPIFFDWAFNLSEKDLCDKWALIPDDTDILVVHGPPRGYGDKAPRANTKGYEHTGSPGLLKRIQEIKPKICVYGHIHGCAHQQWMLDDTILANVGILNDQYKHVYEPMIFELPSNK